ncbi:hypothetical protein GCM10017083_52780 [Thalassobaculum fulvum]|uniref:DUF938 domain-containing protein n=1 Tax=Thalassobaculum fulvum TaxID=1633335 RepID=A0A918XXY6_9PROT|nr:DUF938 domain-containing protein [Thalassobaculum fulvum]GHD63110.1 hypothetical protein GCM10017083_52780 [Thalassobaculum fulvum]
MNAPSAPAAVPRPTVLPPTVLADQPVPPPLDRPAPPAAGDAPAARRNAGPLLAVLRRVLPQSGTVLEIGSGSGQHATAFAAALAPLRWLPTDPRPALAGSLQAWAALLPPAAARPLPPRLLDAAAPLAEWPLEPRDDIRAMVATNVVHIAPWPVAEGILAGAAALLRPGDPLVLYGPFRRDGVHTGDGNAAFDASLRAENPAWGIRDLECEMVPAAGAAGLALDLVQPMPADNLTVVFRRQ